MNEWDERMRAHRVWSEMETLGPTIDSAIAMEGSTPETSAGIERLRAILTYCGKRLAAADPMITAPQPLESVASDLAAVHDELTVFVLDKDPAHVITANQTADAMLVLLAQIPGAYSPEELGALVSTTTEYRSTVQKALAHARKEIQQFNSLLQESLSRLKSTSEEDLTKLHARLEDSSKEFTTKLESIQTSLAQLMASIQLEQQKFSQIVSEQQGQFSTAQEARGKEFTESLRLANEGYTKLVTEYQGQFSAAQDARSRENAAENQRVKPSSTIQSLNTIRNLRTKTSISRNSAPRS